MFGLLILSTTTASLDLNPVLLAGAVLIVLGLACDALIIARFLPAPRFLVDDKPWGMRQLGYSIAAFAGLFLFSNAFYTALAIRRQVDIAALTPLIIPIEFILRLALLAGFDTYFRRRQISLRPALGFDKIPARKAVAWGAAFALAIFPPVGVIIFLTNAVYRLFRLEPSQQPIVEFILNTDSQPLLILLVLFAIVLAPIFEEFLFRGFAYPALKQRLGTLPALLLVSLAFALTHFHAPAFLPLFVLAIGLTFAYELTGSLLAPITMHAVFNSVMLAQIFHQRAHP
ncbi:MAG: hypothetical protein PCFJNLEI_03545 [Verrucomicrobiae bacterium]|nr:hypothetical protein [Verrucomicrobiae bacterium]